MVSKIPQNLQNSPVVKRVSLPESMVSLPLPEEIWVKTLGMNTSLSSFEVSLTWNRISKEICDYRLLVLSKKLKEKGMEEEHPTLCLLIGAKQFKTYIDLVKCLKREASKLSIEFDDEMFSVEQLLALDAKLEKSNFEKYFLSFNNYFSNFGVEKSTITSYKKFNQYFNSLNETQKSEITGLSFSGLGITRFPSVLPCFPRLKFLHIGINNKIAIYPSFLKSMKERLLWSDLLIDC